MARWIENPLLAFLAQVLGIIVLATALWAVAIVVALSVGMVRYDPDGIVRILIVSMPILCFVWWLYTKALRRLAQRLPLKVRPSLSASPLLESST